MSPADGLSTFHTVSGLLADRARDAGGTAALLTDEGEVTFAGLEDAALRLAAGLAGIGIGRGDTVAVWLPNGRDWLELFFACARLGARVFAVNTRFRAVEVADILNRARPAAIAYRPGFLAIDFAAILGEAAARAGPAAAFRPVEIHCGAARPAAAGGAVSLAALRKTRASTAPPPPGPDAGLILFTTSGTTSAPKHVLHTHASIARHACHVARDFAMAEDGAIMLQALPYCGVFGFSQAMAAIAAGRPSTVMETFDAARAVALVRAHGVTHFNATDDMLQAMADAAARADDFATLRLVGAASFNRGPELLAALAETPGLPVVGLYGMSEVQALFARRALDDPPPWRFRAGGRPVAPDAAFRVRDTDTGALLGAGCNGALELRGPSAMSGYDGDAAATAAAITEDGYIRTGDLGSIDETGGFTFENRLGDALRLGGFLVNPAEIARHLETHPHVTACQVVAASDGCRPVAVAFVVAAPGVAPDEGALIDHCAVSLARYKVPARVVTVAEFPTVDGPNGRKVQRGRLRELADDLLTP